MRKIKNEYYWQIDTGNMDISREKLKKILFAVFSIENTEDFEYEVVVKCINDGVWNNSYIDGVVNHFLKDMRNTESGVYRCFAFKFDLYDKKNMEKFCEDFIIEFVSSSLFGTPFIDANGEKFEAYLNIGAKQFILDPVYIPKEELDGFDLEEMYVMGDTKMSMLPPEIARKYFLLNYYSLIWKRGLENDENILKFDRYYVGLG